MSESYQLHESAALKLLLHAAKFPFAAVNGLLLGRPAEDASSPVTVLDAIPLFHTFLSLAPMLETALAQVSTSFCATLCENTRTHTRPCKPSFAEVDQYVAASKALSSVAVGGMVARIDGWNCRSTASQSSKDLGCKLSDTIMQMPTCQTRSLALLPGRLLTKLHSGNQQQSPCWCAPLHQYSGLYSAAARVCLLEFPFVLNIRSPQFANLPALYH